MVKESYNWNDNPLKRVKVEMGSTDLGKMVYFMTHGTTVGYKETRVESLKARQKREKQRNFD